MVGRENRGGETDGESPAARAAHTQVRLPPERAKCAFRQTGEEEEGEEVPVMEFQSLQNTKKSA